MIAGNIKIEDLENITKIADYVDVSGSLETNKKKDKKKIKDFLIKAQEINNENKKRQTSNRPT
jgi:phosphoribosylanthranilate isomerase